MCKSFRYILGKFILSALVVWLAAVTPVAAQDDGANRVQLQVRVLDAKSLYAAIPKNQKVILWGIRPVDELHARARLDVLVGDGAVNCRVMNKSSSPNVFYGRCNNQNNVDLGYTLIREGLAVVDRVQAINSAFEADYTKAEILAREEQRGAWQQGQSSAVTGSSGWLNKILPVLVPIAVVIGPFLGLVIVGFFMRQGLNRLRESQEKEYERARYKESSLRNREKLVLSSSLEGELIENKSKLEAYIAIYKDLLASFDDKTTTPKYQSGGDLLHKHPALSRTIFDANADRLDALDLKLASDVARLYVMIHADVEYTNLDPSTPLETAREMVQKVIDEAELLMPRIVNIIERLAGDHAAIENKGDTAED